MRERPLIPAEQQVAHLAERGVRFDIMSPKDAVAFLRDKNFFFKVKAFAKRFPVIHDFTALVLCFDELSAIRTRGRKRRRACAPCVGASLNTPTTSKSRSSLTEEPGCWEKSCAREPMSSLRAPYSSSAP